MVGMGLEVVEQVSVLLEQRRCGLLNTVGVLIEQRRVALALEGGGGVNGRGDLAVVQLVPVHATEPLVLGDVTGSVLDETAN